MKEWPDNLTEQSLEALQRLRDQNRALAKELRLKSAALVNSRLAKQISLEDYAAGRLSGVDSAEECKRRALEVENELAARRIYATHH